MRHYGGHWAPKFLLLPVTQGDTQASCATGPSQHLRHALPPPRSSGTHSPHKHLWVSAVYYTIPGAGATSMNKPEWWVNPTLKEFKFPLSQKTSGKLEKQIRKIQNVPEEDIDGLVRVRWPGEGSRGSMGVLCAVKGTQYGRSGNCESLRGRRSRSGVEPRVWKEPAMPRQQGTRLDAAKWGKRRSKVGGTCGKQLAAGCQGWCVWGFPLLSASWTRCEHSRGSCRGIAMSLAGGNCVYTGKEGHWGLAEDLSYR